VTEVCFPTKFAMHYFSVSVTSLTRTRTPFDNAKFLSLAHVACDLQIF